MKKIENENKISGILHARHTIASIKEVVNRSVQLRELYVAGEEGQFWLANYYSYRNSKTQIKLNGQLSRSISEQAGVKQGNIKSSDHFKIYINSLLDTIEYSQLGYELKGCISLRDLLS